MIGYDATLIRGDEDSDSFSVVYLNGDVVVAVDTVNHMRDYVAPRSGRSPCRPEPHRQRGRAAQGRRGKCEAVPQQT